MRPRAMHCRRGRHARHWRHGRPPAIPPGRSARPRGRRAAGGGAGAAAVLRLFLLLAGRLLRAASAARRDGHRERRPASAMAVQRHLRRHARGRAGVRMGRGAPAAPTFCPAGVSVLRAQHPDLLRAVHVRGGAHRRRARLLHLGQPLQPVRRLGVLERHGRPLHQRAGTAPVRLHRCGRQRGRLARTVSDGVARGAARPDQPAADRRRAARARGAMRLGAHASRGAAGE